MGLDSQQQYHQQAPVMRDFLGLGKVVRGDDPAEDEVAPEGIFLPVPGSVPSAISMDSTGVRYPLLNIGSAVERNFIVPKNPDERYLEGVAETFGLSYPKPWPGMIVPNAASLDGNTKSSTMQLTIFYGGHVNVYNNIPVDRAEAIMQLAAKGDALSSGISAPPHGMSHTPGFHQPPTVVEKLHGTAQTVAPILFTADQASQNHPLECGIPNTTQSTATSPQPVVPRALPLARKASLARFLEKRKERMQMMSPYLKKQPSAPAAPGEQMLGFLKNPALADLHSQYFTRPSVLFRMQEQTDM